MGSNSAKKYTVMSSVGEGKDFMTGIEFDFVIYDDSIGNKVNCLGGAFTISQNGKIMVLTNKDWVLTIMEKDVPKEEKVRTFEVNKDYEIFFKTKTILVRNECTYEELFRSLKEEWRLAGSLIAETLPFEYNKQMKLFTFLNEWNFEGESMMLIRDGSFSRKTIAGNNI